MPISWSSLRDGNERLSPGSFDWGGGGGRGEGVAPANSAGDLPPGPKGGDCLVPHRGTGTIANDA